jgi:hypothetical protein
MYTAAKKHMARPRCDAISAPSCRTRALAYTFTCIVGAETRAWLSLLWPIAPQLDGHSLFECEIVIFCSYMNLTNFGKQKEYRSRSLNWTIFTAIMYRNNY